VCCTWWCTCTDTELSLHVYRSDTLSQTALPLPLRTAVSALCCTLSQTEHGTQNTLCVCTAMERNIEQKRHCTYNVSVRCVRVINAALINHKYYIFWVRESPKLSTTQARCGLLGSTLFSTVSYKPHDCVKNLLSGIYVLCFLNNAVREFFIPRSFFWRINQKYI